MSRFTKEAIAPPSGGGAYTGAALVDFINELMLAAVTGHHHEDRPENADRGLLWSKKVGDEVHLVLFDGVSDHELARLTSGNEVMINAKTLDGKSATDFARLNETNQFNRTGDFSAVFTGDGEGYGRLIRLNGVAPGADAAASYHSPGIAIWHAGAKGDGTFAFNVGGGGSNYGNDVAKIKNDGDIWSAKFGDLASSAWFAQPALRRTAAASGSLAAYWNNCPSGSFVTGLWRHPTSNGIDHFEWRFAQIQRRDGVWVTMVDG